VTMTIGALSARTGVPVLPALAYGCSLGHSRRWPGTVALSPHTLIDLVVEIGEWVLAAGFRQGRRSCLNSYDNNSPWFHCRRRFLRVSIGSSRRRRWLHLG